MCDQNQTLIRSALLIVKLVAGQTQYVFNNTTFRNKTITKVEVQDSTGQGLVKAPDGSVLAPTSLVSQSYLNLISSVNTTDNIVQLYPTSRFMPSTGTGTGAGLSNYNQVELSGLMNFDIQNSYIQFPDPAVIDNTVAGQSILVVVYYNDRDPAIVYQEYLTWAAGTTVSGRR